MDSSILAIRAITAEFGLQILRPLLIVIVGVYGLLLLLIGWIAATVSAWWWLLATFPTFVAGVLLAIWLVLYVIAKRLAPPMNRRRRAATRRIVSHIGEIAEEVGTPKIVLMIRVLKDILWRPAEGQTYIGSLTQHPGELRREFETLQRLFE